MWKIYEKKNFVKVNKKKCTPTVLFEFQIF